jgi:mannose-6-phosphate isomerase-like protein (cupin superfamily)
MHDTLDQSLEMDGDHQNQEGQVEIFHLTDQAAAVRTSGEEYLEFIRHKSLSVGIYRLRVGAQDMQRPHTEDEVYYIVSGRARVRVGEDDAAVKPGSVVFVSANEEHRFFDISSDLDALVFFAPAEGSCPPSGN